MPRTPEQCIQEFCAAWTRNDPAELIAYFAPDAVYHNMPSAPVTGREAIRASFERFAGNWEEVEFRVLGIASAGSTVFTERLDVIRTAAGRVELPVAGVFEVQDGLITHWRDYFDLESFRKGLAPAS
jgi:limonene-1,2-epoxide hydrolase